MKPDPMAGVREVMRRALEAAKYQLRSYNRMIQVKQKKKKGQT